MLWIRRHLRIQVIDSRDGGFHGWYGIELRGGDDQWVGNGGGDWGRSCHRSGRPRIRGVEEEGGGCVIFLEELWSGGREMTEMLCWHIFHHYCLVHWLEESDSCPICKKKILSFWIFVTSQKPLQVHDSIMSQLRLEGSEWERHKLSSCNQKLLITKILFRVVN